MGRKASNKERNPNRSRTHKWIEPLLPALSDTDLGSLSIDDLARIMGKSKSTVYQYFRSKEEILAYAITLQLKRIENYPEILNRRPILLEKQYLELMQLFSYGLKGISAHLIAQLQTYYPSIWNRIQIVLRGIVHDMQTFYQVCIDQKLIAAYSVELLSGMDQWFIFNYLLEQSPEVELAEVCEEYIRLKFEGLLLK